MPGPLANIAPEYATLDHPVWDEIFPELQPHEFESPGEMDVGFLRLVYKARIRSGVTFRILDTVRDDPRSTHGELPCCALDLQLLSSGERFLIVEAFMHVGIKRIGTYPGSDGEYKKARCRDKGGLHADASRTAPNEKMWTMKIRKKKATS